MRVIDNEPEEELSINIVPMIDVIFAILAFFILSTLFLTQAEGLPVDLPNAETSETQQQADFTVTIEASGDMFLNKEPIDIRALRAAIDEQLQSGQSALVTVQADERVYHGQVIEVMDVLRSLEGVQLGIATESGSADAEQP
ncbi:ExbD/TolR family protein [Almyronema epifaneia]|uniref:ExbD/TolR family protein n=1 Tax=Almyronema epifaneia S1 TaxID=2991925 RepID=A0ABW6IGY2_9CYAN